MQALSLDYRAATGQTQQRVGLLVLIAAIVALVLTGTYYQQIAGELAHVDDLVYKIDRKLHPGRTGERKVAVDVQQTNLEIKSANDVMQQLSLPWSKLFAALEAANNSDIALLGIEPDAKKGLVRISGEAKNFAALFAYVRTLQANEFLSEVFLKHHQIQMQDAEKPIRFTLDASWTEKR